MPNPPNMPARPRPGLRGAAVLAVLAASQLHLLSCHLSPAAPARLGFGRAAPLARFAAWTAQMEDPLVRNVRGRSVELHFVERPRSADTGNTVCALYYSMNYALYPSRAYLGDGRAVVNDFAGIRRADAVPPLPRLRAAGVAAVITFAVTQGPDRLTILPNVEFLTAPAARP